MFDQVHLSQLVWSIIYAFLGVVIFGLAFWACEKLTPFSIKREIEEDHNIALAVIVGAVIIGLAIIVAAAIV
jgi:uncharacterized membrane protein YjfL (UPF0719 family)